MSSLDVDLAAALDAAERPKNKIIRVTLLSPSKEGGLLGPKTKKNTGVPITVTRPNKQSGKMSTFTFMLPSEAYRDWFDGVLSYTHLIIAPLRAAGIPLPLANQVGIAATIYMDRDSRADLCGFLQAIGDCIQAPIVKDKPRPAKKGGGWELKETRKGLGLIMDDYQIVSWDGSRIAIDRARPRVELAITVFGEPRTVARQEGLAFEDEF